MVRRDSQEYTLLHLKYPGVSFMRFMRLDKKNKSADEKNDSNENL